MARVWRLGAVLLAGCSSIQPVADDIAVPNLVDATVSDAASFPDGSFVDVGPSYNGGGPFLCINGCVCDGTLYMCTPGTLPDGGCPGGGGPGMPLFGDAGDDAGDAGAADASACALAGDPCHQIPIQCLPKPTCACISQVTGLECVLDSSGSGFVLVCPPPPP